MRLSLTLVFTVLCCSLSAQKVFDFNATCQEAYHDILSLKIDAGARLIATEKKAHPDNLIPYFLDNYIDFLVLFFNEDPAEYERRSPHKEENLDRMEEGPQNSPFFRFTRSIINFQWAAVEMKFEGNVGAALGIRKSFIEIKENHRLYPTFTPNLMIYGAMQTVVGVVPDGYKWLASAMGLTGTVKGGMAMVSEFINDRDPWARLFRDEGIFYYAYLRFYILNEREEVFHFLEEEHLDTVNNLLFAYLVANLALNNQRADITESIIRGKSPSPEFMSTPIWDMEMGYARLDHLQPDANVFLERFLSNYHGNSGLKDVLQKISWYYYLQGNMPMANRYRKLVISRGEAHTEADKNALRDAQMGTWPNKLMVEARLLSDGGYHADALRLLSGKSSSDFPDFADQLEFSYRLGRIYDDLGRSDDAIQAYLVAIKMGEKRKEYFAARAAWQVGYIYERRGNKNMAIAFYQRCLHMPDHEYKNSLDQKAKAGIARCNGT
jgi:tetratricopeptide (TPR) repeat protein